MILVAKHINFSVVTSIPAGTATAVLGAFIFVMTAFGLGWVNAAADYSRYLPRGVPPAKEWSALDHGVRRCAGAERSW